MKNIWDIFLDLIYPPDLYCICCGKIIDSTRTYRLCNECMDGIKWANGRLCAKCGKLLSASNPGNICFNCREHPHQFDHGYTCTEYGTHERAMVFALKYHSRADIGVTVGEIMATVERDRAFYGERGGITLSGGDPLLQPRAVIAAADAAHAKGLTVWCYTGWTFEEIMKGSAGPDAVEALNHIDVLVDGPFRMELLSRECIYRGSSNQRLVDVPASLSAGAAREVKSL